MAFKERLKKIREMRGFSSQAMLAARIGVSSGTIGNYESGVRVPTDEIMNELAELFNVPAADLALGKQLTDSQYDEFVRRISDALDHTSSDDLKALGISEHTLRNAIRQREPIREDRAVALASTLNVQIRDILEHSYAPYRPVRPVDELIKDLRIATDEEIRKTHEYLRFLISQRGKK